jgi:hypothetical protein
MPKASDIIGGMLANMGPGLAGGLGKALVGGEPDQQKPGSKPGENGPGLATFKKGGTVPKDEVALVHKGELVIPKDKVAATHKAMHGLLAGKLHEHLGVSPQEVIPQSKIAQATKSDNHEVRTMALLHQEYAPLIHKVAKKAHASKTWQDSAHKLGGK